MFLHSSILGQERKTNILSIYNQNRIFDILKGNFSDLNSCFVYHGWDMKKIYTDKAKVYLKFQGTNRFSIFIPILTKNIINLQMTSVAKNIFEDTHELYFDIELNGSSKYSSSGKIQGNIQIYNLQNNKIKVRLNFFQSFNSCSPMSEFEIPLSKENKNVIEEIINSDK
jgi:hypothetical protein